MSDDTTLRGGQDRARIDLNQDQKFVTGQRRSASRQASCAKRSRALALLPLRGFVNFSARVELDARAMRCYEQALGLLARAGLQRRR